MAVVASLYDQYITLAHYIQNERSVRRAAQRHIRCMRARLSSKRQ